ncbi:OmpP1/FadL family transporter [Pedobacter heparinus]|uniref:Membrane protein involved in aromatic hydrocarbon degradation n=1 Tax=Pedobacter heparinus (strain ATCC 13125 / DSM 2366 / CIP 104194 / JCM 7457 / NBRC 12017 / NCIMB 9290 / NRRL B-14731 / HIM 762-3) TaxID=485917 RepID=C6Y1W8_PEDHD|nr:aromatic hydrocarbon degradation membrane protein [Pedobacter heparinus]ACU05110.1 membrane protein involved in aromatic hydrocarbon degradation [Pedobacter heparinus DSM 2366]
MKKFTQMLMVAMVATTGTTYAQYAGDAIRFSNGNYGSSARFKGMGNAQIGVGGDMSSLGGNPAGLGLFTRSEFSFTPEFNSAGSKSDFLGNRTNDSGNKLNVNQAGVVWYNPTYRIQGENTNKGVLSTVFGIGFNRNADFTQHYTYGGDNTANSMRNYFAELANGSKNQQGDLAAKSLENYAFEDYLINFNTPGNANNYTTNGVTGANQVKKQISSGGTSELNFSGALNISNQLYIGASIGMVNARYTSDAEFTEKGTVNPYDPTDGFTGNENYSFTYAQNQETKASGVNGRLGMIFRPAGNFRIGATFQTPTWLYVEDIYAENLYTTLSGERFPSRNALNYSYNYRLKTPLKGSLGASYVIGGQAILSADVDFIDYASTRFSQDGGGTPDQTIMDNNADIKRLYTSAVNYRVGGEYKLNNLSLRAGYGLNGSPLKDDTQNIFDTKYYSAGLGYRVNEYYIDLAYQRVESQDRVSPYSLNNGTEPVASLKNANNNVFLTFGIRF